MTWVNVRKISRVIHSILFWIIQKLHFSKLLLKRCQRYHMFCMYVFFVFHQRIPTYFKEWPCREQEISLKQVWPVEIKINDKRAVNYVHLWINWISILDCIVSSHVMWTFIHLRHFSIRHKPSTNISVWIIITISMYNNKALMFDMVCHRKVVFYKNKYFLPIVHILFGKIAHLDGFNNLNSRKFYSLCGYRNFNQ